MSLHLAVWSGPRNISTAMMRSWENRPDCTVVDEPFYGAYLHRTGLQHPGRDEVVAAQPTDPVEVVRALLDEDRAPVHYLKLMSHHLLPGDDLGWLDEARTVLLVRDPAEGVASYVRSRESCEPADIGLLQQQAMLPRLPDDTPVLDASDFLGDPKSHLRWLCAWLGVEFTSTMLRWPAGPRESDGVWAPYWYDAVLASTGFAAPLPREVRLSTHDAAVAEACRPAYDELRERRLVLG